MDGPSIASSVLSVGWSVWRSVVGQLVCGSLDRDGFGLQPIGALCRPVDLSARGSVDLWLGVMGE